MIATADPSVETFIRSKLAGFRTAAPFLLLEAMSAGALSSWECYCVVNRSRLPASSVYVFERLKRLGMIKARRRYCGPYELTESGQYALAFYQNGKRLACTCCSKLFQVGRRDYTRCANCQWHRCSAEQRRCGVGREHPELDGSNRGDPVAAE